jgi:hypothetical protein
LKEKEGDITGVILYEWSASHSEFLHAQIRFLNAAGIRVWVWVSAESPFEVQAGTNVEEVFKIKERGFWYRLGHYVVLRKFIKEQRISHLVINTAHGLYGRDLALALIGCAINVTGICHFAEKLGRSATQKMITWRVRKYLVLHPYMARWAKAVEGVRLHPFYYIFFNEQTGSGAAYVPKGKGETLRIVVPGALEPDRRDYYGLLSFVKEHEIYLANSADSGNSGNSGNLGDLPTVEFDILGNAYSSEFGRNFKEEVEKAGVAKYFRFYESFVPDSIFYGRIAACHAVMPLIHPGLKAWEIFTKYSISGAYNLAFGFRKPVLVWEEPFSSYELFDQVGVFYTYPTLLYALQQMAIGELLLEKHLAYADILWLTFEKQEEGYVQFLAS